jgi:hypothetical protein
VIVEKVFVEGVQLNTGAASYYSTSDKVLAVIRRATLTNTTAAAVAATVYLTPPGAAVDPSNAIVWQKSIAAGVTADLYWLVDHVLLPAGAAIQAFAASPASLTFRVSGYERAIV